MLVHSVYFWLKPESTPEHRTAFRRGLESLRGIQGVESLHVGRPAATAARPVIERSYDFALIAALKDMAAHDAYQIDPLHKAFLQEFSSCWDRVLIFDAE